MAELGFGETEQNDRGSTKRLIEVGYAQKTLKKSMRWAKR